MEVPRGPVRVTRRAARAPCRAARLDGPPAVPDARHGAMSVVLTPSTRAQRDRLVRLGVMIFLASLPIAAVLLALVNWQVALGYIVIWAAGPVFCVRPPRTPAPRPGPPRAP